MGAGACELKELGKNVEVVRTQRSRVRSARAATRARRRVVGSRWHGRARAAERRRAPSSTAACTACTRGPGSRRGTRAARSRANTPWSLTRGRAGPHAGAQGRNGGGGSVGWLYRRSGSGTPAHRWRGGRWSGTRGEAAARWPTRSMGKAEKPEGVNPWRKRRK